jgi:hypothetical protein
LFNKRPVSRFGDTELSGFYNEQRPHSAFGITTPKTPMEVYRQPVPLAINQ